MNGMYQVSNYGNVKALGGRIKKEKIIKQTNDGWGYLKVELCKNRKKRSYKVHRLVANAFLSKENFKSMPYEDRDAIDLDKLEVNHKNEFNKTNNNAENLEWCTHTYNNCYGTKIQRMRKTLSKSVLQYDLNGNLIKIWNSCTEASKNLNINLSNLVGSCNGKRITAGKYIWRYEKQKGEGYHESSREKKTSQKIQYT